MSVSLIKTQVAASNSEGLAVMLDLPPAGNWLARPVPFEVERVTSGNVDGYVWLVGEFADSIGGSDIVYVPATHVMALV